MAVDAVLWLIVGAGVALVWSGCVMTAGRKPADFRRGWFGH